MEPRSCWLLLAFLSFACRAQQPPQVGNSAHRRVAIRCGTLIDGITDTPAHGRVVLVQDGRIIEVGETVPADAELVDLGDFTVLPGLIDMHVHLADAPELTGDPKQHLLRSEQDALALARRNALTTLRAGFTSVRDVGSYRAWTARDLRDEIRAGTTPGPRMQVAGPYLTIPGGGGDMLLPGLAENDVPAVFRVGVSRGVDSFREHARAVIAERVDLLKLITSGAVLAFNGIPGEPEMSEAEIAAVTEVAHRDGLKVAAHAHGSRSIIEAIRAGADTIEHATYLDDAGIALAKERGVAFSMDVYDGDFIDADGRTHGWPAEFLQKNLDTMEIQRRAFTKALHAGAKLVYGTDAAVYPHGDNAKQLAVMVALGMTPMQAIRSATSVSADVMGWSADVGAVIPGRYADLIAVRGAPLDDVRVLEHVAVVMLGGAVVHDAR